MRCTACKHGMCYGSSEVLSASPTNALVIFVRCVS